MFNPCFPRLIHSPGSALGAVTCFFSSLRLSSLFEKPTPPTFLPSSSLSLSSLVNSSLFSSPDAVISDSVRLPFCRICVRLSPRPAAQQFRYLSISQSNKVRCCRCCCCCRSRRVRSCCVVSRRRMFARQLVLGLVSASPNISPACSLLLYRTARVKLFSSHPIEKAAHSSKATHIVG